MSIQNVLQTTLANPAAVQRLINEYATHQATAWLLMQARAVHERKQAELDQAAANPTNLSTKHCRT